MYSENKRNNYGWFSGKWKSERLVFEYCKNIFGEDDVLFQYSPSFLGKKSYDVYIISEAIAIEYQGLQHFQAVDFFGGKEHLEDQQLRDKDKKYLSKLNGVTLIEILYNEVISEELIIRKIERAKHKKICKKQSSGYSEGSR